MNYNPNSNINNTIIDDDQNGTPVHALKKHLDNIGYVPQQMNQMQQIQQIQQMQQMQHMQQMQQMQKMQQIKHMQQMQQQQMQQQQMQQMQYLNQMQKKQTQTNKINKKNIHDNMDYTEQPDITCLVSDINKSLDNYSPSNQDVPSDDEPIEEFEGYEYKSYLPDWFKEFLLILLIYLILSQNFVKTFIGKYIKYVNPNDDGTVSFSGLVIYGTILAVIYLIFKRLLI